jgi:hypothetical protein
MKNKRLTLRVLLVSVAWFFLPLSGCDYGQLGGADVTGTLRPGDDQFEAIMSSMSGVWYSHYAGMGRLDGYRIGKWDDFAALVEDSGKIDLFPGVVKPYTAESGSPPVAGDYFVLYDDTVFGQTDSGTGGNGVWDKAAHYIGIVRAINTFNGDPDRGAVIIEYLKGCAPQWDEGIKNGQRPFFGVYYRVLNKDRVKMNTVQMANAVNLAALYAGEKYYTETKTLNEAIELNTVENEAEFISWGVVIPQDRE